MEIVLFGNGRDQRFAVSEKCESRPGLQEGKTKIP
jgi:hypothetical protein